MSRHVRRSERDRAARRSARARPAPGSSSAGEVRLIAGRWRGRRLPVASVAGLRPSGDRLRETLFNWLQPTLSGARCVDLFAGSGALGFEALSRGAASLVLVETDREARRVLAESVTRLDAEAMVTLDAGPAARFVAMAEGPFDLLFADPPFDRPELLECLPLAEALLAPNARLYIEQPASRSFELEQPGWISWRERRFGDVVARLFRRS